MSTIEAVIARMLRLSPEQQQNVLEYVERIQPSTEAHKAPERPLLGLWEGLQPPITEEDIEEARREMWGNFPRSDI